jgi:hypothetical protein
LFSASVGKILSQERIDRSEMWICIGADKLLLDSKKKPTKIKIVYVLYEIISSLHRYRTRTRSVTGTIFCSQGNLLKGSFDAFDASKILNYKYSFIAELSCSRRQSFTVSYKYRAQKISLKYKRSDNRKNFKIFLSTQQIWAQGIIRSPSHQ